MKSTAITIHALPAGKYLSELAGVEYLDDYYQPLVRLGFRLLDGPCAGDVIDRVLAAQISPNSLLGSFTAMLMGQYKPNATIDDLRALVGVRGLLTIKRHGSMAQPASFVREEIATGDED